MDFLETTVRRVTLEKEAQSDPEDPLDRMDDREQQERQALPAQWVLLDCLAHPDLQDMSV